VTDSYLYKKNTTEIIDIAIIDSRNRFLKFGIWLNIMIF